MPTDGVLFDIDGTLITTGGAGRRAWRAFGEIYDTQVDIRKVTESGMTDPDVGRTALRHVLDRDPEQRELALAMAKYMKYLASAVEESDGYEVMPGVVPRLRQLVDDGYLVGLVTGNVEAAAHIKLSRGRLNRFFSFGGYGSDASDRAEVTKKALEARPARVRRDAQPEFVRGGGRHAARRQRRRRDQLHRGRDQQLQRGSASRGGRRPRDRDAREELPL